MGDDLNVHLRLQSRPDDGQQVRYRQLAEFTLADALRDHQRDGVPARFLSARAAWARASAE